jgi:RNA polymerase sigma-70 factor (ECF subfamily)
VPDESVAQDRDDLSLLRAAETGDAAAFDLLVARYEAPVFRFVRSLLRTDADAEDALQQTFLAVWRTVSSGKARKTGEASVRSWLFAIARNNAYRGARRRAGEPAQHESVEQLGKEAGWGQQGDPEALAAALESRARLAAALAALPDEQREVVVLRDVEGLTGPETAAVLGIDLGAAKSRLHRARLALRAQLREEGSDEG